MSLFLKPSGFLFGEIAHPPSIPGYAVIARPRYWLVARDLAGEEFIVEKTPFGFHLHPIEQSTLKATRIDETRMRTV